MPGTGVDSGIDWVVLLMTGVDPEGVVLSETGVCPGIEWVGLSGSRLV